MTYYLDLFSPETHRAFSLSSRAVSGFSKRQRGVADGVILGDKLICYITRISRSVSVLEVTSPAFEDATPIFFEKNDPFVVRFAVKPLVWLDDLRQAIPIHEEKVLGDPLHKTKDYDPHGKTSTGPSARA